MVVVVVVVVVVEKVPQNVPPKLAQFSGVVWPLILKQAQNPPRNKQEHYRRRHKPSQTGPICGDPSCPWSSKHSTGTLGCRKGSFQLQDLAA